MACWFLALGLKFKAVRRGVGQRGTGRPTAELRQCTHRDRGVQHRFCTMVQVHPSSGAHCISVHGALHAISVHNTLHLCSRHAASYAASYALACIFMQSRTIIEIASRLQIRPQATHKRNRVAECMQHAPEISGLPGFDRWRRSQRV